MEAWNMGFTDISDIQQTRKRPRSTSPVPPPSSRLPPTKNELVQQLQDPKQANNGLNALMQATASHETGFTIESDDKILQSLIDLIDYDKGERNEFHTVDELVPENAWKLLNKKPKFPLETIPKLHAVLVILRNLSFVAANLRPMTQHLPLMELLINCLYLDNADLLVYAVFTLVNLATVLDITGHRLLADQLFLDTTKEIHTLGWGGLQFGKQLDDTHQASVDKEMLWEGTSLYVTQMWQIFAALHHVVVSSLTTRPVLMMTLDWIRELLDHQAPSPELPSMHDIFRKLPADMMERLVDCLWIPRLGPDALDYVNPITNIVSRVSTLKLFMGYDATVDTDLRDRALDILTQLLGLGLTVPSSARLYNALLPCLQTKVGRNDAQILCSGIVKALGKSDEHQDGLLYAQARMVELASKDVRVAELVLGSLYAQKD
jgi:hypothetical protein